jgi:hypothetical protein
MTSAEHPAATMTTMALAMLAMASLAACLGPTATVASRRSSELRDRVADVFVISQAGSSGEVSAASFEKTLVETSQACGVRLGVSSVSRLELNPEVHVLRMKQFGSRYLITVEATGGTTRNGAIVVATYDAKLVSDGSKQLLWRANVSLNRGEGPFGDAGATLAMALLRKLNSDRVIPHCESLVEPVEPSYRSRP